MPVPSPAHNMRASSWVSSRASSHTASPVPAGSVVSETHSGASPTPAPETRRQLRLRKVREGPRCVPVSVMTKKAAQPAPPAPPATRRG